MEKEYIEYKQRKRDEQAERQVGDGISAEEYAVQKQGGDHERDAQAQFALLEKISVLRENYKTEQHAHDKQYTKTQKVCLHAFIVEEIGRKGRLRCVLPAYAVGCEEYKRQHGAGIARKDAYKHHCQRSQRKKSYFPAKNGTQENEHRIYGGEIVTIEKPCHMPEHRQLRHRFYSLP